MQMSRDDNCSKRASSLEKSVEEKPSNRFKNESSKLSVVFAYDHTGIVPSEPKGVAECCTHRTGSRR
jgi:hypothetical protein